MLLSNRLCSIRKAHAPMTCMSGTHHVETHEMIPGASKSSHRRTRTNLMRAIGQVTSTSIFTRGVILNHTLLASRTTAVHTVRNRTLSPQGTPELLNQSRLYSKMTSDEDYEAFLNKANQASSGTNTQSKSVGVKSVDTEVPKVLESVDEVFVSDADEPFEPVSLKYKGKSLPSSDELGNLLGKSVEEISEKQFDSQGQYKKVVDAVKEAGDGKVGFFKAEIGKTRTQYIVLSIDTKHGRIVGLKALAVES